MQATSLYNVLLLIAVVIPIHSMERDIITLHKPSTQQPVYEENAHLSKYKQPNIPLPYDVLNKIFASYFSHTERKTVKLVCKQFYYAAHINELPKLVCHDFIIGNEKEKDAFFKAFIKQNNPRLIKPLLEHARKEAQTEANAVCIKLGYPTQLEVEKEYTQQELMQKTYLTPLLIEALQQKNTKMIDQLSRENTDPTVLHNYYATIQAKKDQEKFITTVLCGIVIFMINVMGVGIVVYNLTCHNKWHVTFGLECNGTIIYVTPDSCNPTGCNMSGGIPVPCGLNCREDI